MKLGINSRRDFLLNLTSTAVLSSLGQPLCLWGSETEEPRSTVFIFLRGGADGLQICHPLSSASQLLSYLLNVRRPLILPENLDAQNAYARSEIIPIGSQFGLHPWWERLMNMNNPAPGKSARIKCETVNGVPLSNYIAVRLMKGVGMLHFYDQPVSSLRHVQFEKSHFNAQQLALIAMIAVSRNIGFLGKAVFKNCPDCNSIEDSLRLLGFGGWSQSELGGTEQRTIYSINSNFSELLVDRLLGLSFPQRSCRNYYQSTNFRAHDNWTYIQQLVSALQEEYRDAVGLKRLFLDAYEKGKVAQELLYELRNTVIAPAGTSANSLTNMYSAQSYIRSNNQWVPDPKPWERSSSIRGVFMNVARFLLSSEPGLINRDKMVALSIGGFDTHADQNPALTSLITQLAGGIHGLFWSFATVKPNLLKKLSVYIMTEFGRTVASNGANSTDHGAGNILLAFFGLPGPVNANRTYDRELGPEFLVAGSTKE
ncbi:MAG: DUF1501 domain-containing protein, partial [Deltaproteobacteria bacterium]|nr:DUF1501 domain-containing protein [Deltaproteobacteria bacterium]